MALPLAVRKGIRDNEPKLQGHLEKIAKITGKEWSFEAEWEKLVALDESYKDKLGALIQDEAMEKLVKNLERVCKSETTKESLNEACGNSKIVFRANPNLKKVGTFTTQWGLAFDNGDLVVEMKAYHNPREIEEFKTEEHIPAPSGGMSLPLRLNIEKNRAKVDEYLEKITKATGVDGWTFEPEYEDAIKKIDARNVPSLGDDYREAFGSLTEGIVNNMKNETLKEAFNEAISERRIVIRVEDGLSDYWRYKVENGTLVLAHKPNGPGPTINIKNQPMAPVIPVPGLIDLVARLNINDKRAKLDGYLERIKKVTGEEYSFDDTCLEELYKTYGNKQQLGTWAYDEVMEGIAQLLEKNCKDEMVKEAFNETATARQISVRIDKSIDKYWTVKFENGVFVLVTKAPHDIINIKNIDLEKLL